MSIKKIISTLIFIILMLVQFVSYAQQQDRISQTVKDSSYVKLIDSFQSPHKFYQELNSMSLNELKHNARIIYESEEKDPLAVDKEIENHHKWKISPAYFKRILLKNVKTRISLLDFMLISTPCLIKAKILTVNTYPYKVEGGPAGMNLGEIPKTEVTACIDEIIKGKEYFSLKDTIKFYFFSFWRPTRWNFEIGETCLLPLQPLINNNNRKTEIALVAWMDNKGNDVSAVNPKDSSSYGRYPLINDTLIDRRNSFGLGTKIKWENFKSIISNEIDKIKSW